MTSRITAVLFDLGDTLVQGPTAPLETGLQRAQERVASLLSAWGFPADGSLARQAYQAAQAAELEAYRSAGVLPPLWAIARQVAASKGLSLTEEQARQFWEACRIDERTLGRTPAPDALATLAWLKERGIRLGCITNTLFGGAPFRQGLEADGLAPYLDVVAISCDLGFIKPHPQLFRHALAALRAHPQETIMVGDSLRADVSGAKALGMFAVWKRRTDAFPGIERALMRAGLGPAFEPDYVIDTLWQLTQLPLLKEL